MKAFAVFIEKMVNLRRLRDLHKLFSREQEIEDSMENCLPLMGTKSLLFQGDTHTHLANQAALSYWQSNQNAIQITNPVKITMSYGRSRTAPTATKSVWIKNLKPIH